LAEKTDSGIWLHQDRSGNRFYTRIFSQATQYQGQEARLVTAVDVNYAYRAEQEIRNITSAIEHATLICKTDLQGIITEMNDPYIQLSGYERQELIGHSVDRLASDHHNPAFWEQMWVTIRSGKVWRNEICNRRPDGSTYWLYSVISPVITNEGEISGFLSLNQ
ncbi:PAS domain-containing protein, partial [Arthrospira platensis SPKY1]|nr:PAS domain-containing protein [Arthrospira platensis SPKY1]